MNRLRPSRWPRRKPTRRGLQTIFRTLRHHYGPRHWWPAETPFEVVVGAILTQNTAWSNVEKAIQNLKNVDALHFDTLIRMPVKRLSGLIRPAGYFNIKAARLKNFLDFLKRQFNGRLKKLFHLPLPELRSTLLEVNGIGEETADSIILYAANRKAFVVDAYTRRILLRHRYIKGDESYGDIQSLFVRHFPGSVAEYNEFHALIVEVGKEYCRSAPQCEFCPLRNNL